MLQCQATEVKLEVAIVAGRRQGWRRGHLRADGLILFITKPNKLTVTVPVNYVGLYKVLYFVISLGTAGI